MLPATPRAVAAQTLLKREHGDAYTEIVLEQNLEQTQLSALDRALCRELVLGCVRWQATLDDLIARRTGGQKQRPALRVLLRLGLYQLFWLERIPPHASVNESVELARQFGCGAQTGFINALLRGYSRKLPSTRDYLQHLKSSQPALGWSHPEWLISRWVKHFGCDKAADLLKWNNTPAATFARVNTLKADAGKLLDCWRNENVEYEFVNHSWLPDNLMFRLKSHPPLSRLRSFQDGGFYAQDPSTLLAPLMLDPQPGETVLDLCAAPGGKTSLMAQLMNNNGRIVACDPSDKRLQRLRENCVRLGASCVEVTSTSRAESGIPAVFDRVLVDAPCSNTGVMRRRVDLRWRIQLGEIERLAATQLELLKTAAQRIKSGGCLVYSTCSLEMEENQEVVKRFLEGAPVFELEDQQTLVPSQDGVDGAYAAVLKRRTGPITGSTCDLQPSRPALRNDSMSTSP